MSYTKRRVRALARPRKPALGGVMDWLSDAAAALTGQSSLIAAATSQCKDAVNAQAVNLQGSIDSLNATWNPTGYYTPQDFSAAIQQGMFVAGLAKDTLAKAPLPASDSQGIIDAAVNNITTQTQKGLELIGQYQAAVAQGATVIDAPGLKQYVLDAMQASYDGIAVAGMMTCNMPWLATGIIEFQKGFDQVWTVVTKIAGVIANVGDLVYKVSGDLSDLWTAAKWIAIIGGAAWVAIKLGETRRKAHQSP